MLTAKDIMTREVITFTPETSVAEAARVLVEKHINGAPVVSGGRIVGVLTQSDLVTQQKQLNLPSVFTILDAVIPLSSSAKFEREMEKIAALTVGQAMTAEPVTVSPDTPLTAIAGLMVDRKLHTLPVVVAGQVVGIIGMEDILRTLTKG
jgi:CBS domain-containing protein